MKKEEKERDGNGGRWERSWRERRETRRRGKENTKERIMEGGKYKMRYMRKQA